MDHPSPGVEHDQSDAGWMLAISRVIRQRFPAMKPKRTRKEQVRLAKRIRYRWNLRKQAKANFLGAHMNHAGQTPHRFR